MCVYALGFLAFLFQPIFGGKKTTKQLCDDDGWNYHCFFLLNFYKFSVVKTVQAESFNN